VSKKLLLPVGVLLLVVSARVMFLMLPPLLRTFLPFSIVILLLLPVENDFARRSLPRDSEVTEAQLIWENRWWQQKTACKKTDANFQCNSS
jgi:hypothetical protein